MKKAQMERQWFVFLNTFFKYLFRTYNPEIQSVQYLADVVVCNHLVVSSMKADNNSSELTLKTHLTQFANTELMRQYGRLLVDYRNKPIFLHNTAFFRFP